MSAGGNPFPDLEPDHGARRINAVLAALRKLSCDQFIQDQMTISQCREAASYRSSWQVHARLVEAATGEWFATALPNVMEVPRTRLGINNAYSACLGRFSEVDVAVLRNRHLRQDIA